MSILDFQSFHVTQVKNKIAPRSINKALAKLSNKVGFNVPTLLDPTLFHRLAAHVG